jgi:hypothetical protein
LSARVAELVERVPVVRELVVRALLVRGPPVEARDFDERVPPELVDPPDLVDRVVPRDRVRRGCVMSPSRLAFSPVDAGAPI